MAGNLYPGVRFFVPMEELMALLAEAQVHLGVSWVSKQGWLGGSELPNGVADLGL